MPAPQTVAQLVDRFDRNREAYLSGQYNETQVRREFIDPLFETLGWDVNNTKGYAEPYKDVIHEDAIKIGGATKAPDYCFRIGGARKFFLEAKKPAVKIRDDLSPAYQLRRYAWSAKLALSVLTDFEEFALYDTRVRPAPTDSAATARVMYVRYSDYETKWADIESILSREAILRGSFDKYAESARAKRGTAEVDAEFLKEIEAWRDALARNIAIRNDNIGQRELNTAVQQTIDRIIFLRLCEDRGIETYGRLQQHLNGADVYQRLMKIFRDADDRYNSGLFHFRPEKGRENHDRLTPTLNIDDKTLKDIIRRLYYPESPYEFSVLPADILGQVYEQFLGKVIRLTKSHQAKVEEKPEVRKAGGVYYTPTYIVQYIVKNTIGKLLEGKTVGSRSRATALESPATEVGSRSRATEIQPPSPTVGSRSVGEKGFRRRGVPAALPSAKIATEKEETRRGRRVYASAPEVLDSLSPPTTPSTPSTMSTPSTPLGRPPAVVGGVPHLAQASPSPHPPAPLRILDPACGSGSFLICAYQFLLDWYRDQYAAQPEKYSRGRNPRIYQRAHNDYALTSQERKRILLDHIYGVDIDPQAVEVTKLSLLLKVLEGENAESIGQTLNLFHERALPDLNQNIKCGNSLIAPDFYNGQQTDLFDPEEMYRINAFDWNQEFPFLTTDGGFDAVIGNPPYIRIQTMKEWAPVEVEAYKKLYQSAASGNYDIYVVFIEKGLSLLNQSGRLGFICPHKFFNAKYGEGIRNVLSAGNHLEHVVHFGDQQIFRGASTYTCLLFLCMKEQSSCTVCTVNQLNEWRLCSNASASTLSLGDITKAPWNFAIGSDSGLLTRLSKHLTTLSDVAARIAQGIRTSANEVYVLDLLEERADTIIARSKLSDEEVILDRENVSMFLQGRDIKPYRIYNSGKVVIIPYAMEDGVSRLLDAEEFARNSPNTFSYLLQHKRYLESREKGRMAGSSWYGYIYPKNLDVMASPKILVPDIADTGSFAFDESGQYAFTSGYGIILNKNCHLSPKYVLGLLNSRLLDFCLKHISTTMRGGFFRYFTQYLQQLPIKTLDLACRAEKRQHDKLVSLVTQMLDLYKRLQTANTDHDRTIFQRQITTCDQQIDQLVYDLYGLTEEEIEVVENKN